MERKKDDIMGLISNIRSNIFEFKIAMAIEQTFELLNKVVKMSSNWENQKKESLNLLINDVNLALDNKDYLLVSDLIFYELNNLLEEHE
jgi:hypothetical protein